MSTQTRNKVQIWQKVLREVAEMVDFGTLAMLRDNAYLDSLDDGVAKIGCKSYTWRDVFHQKQLWKPLEQVFSELYDTKIRVIFAHGRPRIMENKTSQQAHNSLAEAQDAELKELHSQYGDIMGIVDNHPLFKQASTAVEKGGWGIWPQILTTSCKEYGVMTVLKGLRDVAASPDITRPRSYFLTCLRNGRWGHRLVITPSHTGPAPAAR